MGFVNLNKVKFELQESGRILVVSLVFMVTPCLLDESMSPTSVHPLQPLTAEEITVARGVVINSYEKSTVISFRAIQLQEPKKAELIPYLSAEHAGEVTFSTRRPPRLAKAQFYVNTGKKSQYVQSTIDLQTGKEVKRRTFDPETPVGMSM